MSTEATIFSGVGIYLVIMLIIGLYASKRAGSAADFIVSGRRIAYRDLFGYPDGNLVRRRYHDGLLHGAAYDGGLLGVIARSLWGGPGQCSWPAFSSSACSGV